MPTSVFHRVFAGGELAPAYHGRADLPLYSRAVRRCRNWLVRREGGACNRPGLKFIAETKNGTDDDVILMRYEHETPGQSILIEHGKGYLRFYRNGEPVVDPSNPSDVYELALPQSDDLYNWSQDGRTITLTHTSQPPYELRYNAADDWDLVPIVTAPSIEPPTSGLMGTAGTPSGTRTFRYVVTSAKAETHEESLPSAVIEIASADEPTKDAPNELGWDTVADAAEYHVYLDPYQNGKFGFIGTATAGSFKDVGFVADFAVTPPLARSLFAAGGTYPAVSGTYQQRRFFGRSLIEPAGVWGSRIGFPMNFAITSPLQDDDAVTFRIAGNGNHPVQFFVPLKTLVTLTGRGVWAVGSQERPILPNQIELDQQVYVGSYDKKPVAVGNRVIFVESRGGMIFECSFDPQQTTFGARELTLYASHFLKGRTVSRIDYARDPYSIVWAVHGGDSFLGMTYVPEDEIFGWHKHTSDGDVFDDVCVVPEEGEDGAYFLVARTINAEQRYYIERLASRQIDPDNLAASAFFVDSGITDESGEQTIDVAHLDGREVVALVDGEPQGPFFVNGGQVTLEAAGSIVHVGLPIREADLETLDLDVAGADVAPKRKRSGPLTLLLEETPELVFKAGPDADHLRAYPQQPTDAADEYGERKVELGTTSRFDVNGRITIRMDLPLPMTVLGIIPAMELGG